MKRKYAPPVSRLLELGEIDDPSRPSADPSGWPDYAAMGLGPEHAPELIALACDAALTASQEKRDWFAPIHAWRALAQFRAAEAVAPLLTLLERLARRQDEWALEELPHVLGRIGPPAVRGVAAHLRDVRNHEYSRGAAAQALRLIAERHPECRAAAVAVLREVLGRAAYHGEFVNGVVVSELIDLYATEAEPEIVAAFEHGHMDPRMAGDLDQVLIELHETPQERQARRLAVEQRIREMAARPLGKRPEAPEPGVQAPGEPAEFDLARLGVASDAAERLSRRTRVRVAWYTPATYARFREISADKEEWEATFDEWVEVAEAGLAERFPARDYAVEKIVIDPEAVAAWCRQRGVPVDSRARRDFALGA